MLDPRKWAFLVFEENPPKNIRRTNVLLVGIFENALKKLFAVKNATLAIFLMH